MLCWKVSSNTGRKIPADNEIAVVSMDDEHTAPKVTGGTTASMRAVRVGDK